jgi:hypothetical protein
VKLKIEPERSTVYGERCDKECDAAVDAISHFADVLFGLDRRLAFIEG